MENKKKENQKKPSKNKPKRHKYDFSCTEEEIEEIIEERTNSNRRKNYA